MSFKLFVSSAMALAVALLVPAGTWAAGSQASFTAEKTLQIPGATLAPGNYVFDVEDRLSDRAIVRVTAAGGGTHYLLLAAPNPELSGVGKNRFLFYQRKEDETLQGWACPGCTATLEFVYPKAEAAEISERSGKSVLAADPSYDKLPDHLSTDDMKVVTLWLLTPKRVTADGRGVGLAASKYTAPSDPAAIQVASAPETQGAASHHPRMPKTAGNTYLLMLIGVTLALISWGSRRSRESKNTKGGVE